MTDDVQEPLSPSGEKTWTERALSPFAEVLAGEGTTAVLMAGNVFLLLLAYYLLKVVREPLILLGGAFGLQGATLQAGAAAGTSMLLLAVVPAYSLLAGKVSRMPLINTVTLFVVACLVVFDGLGHLGVHVGLLFFVWLGAFNLIIVAQFWSFANDIYTQGQGKRLFPIVAFGGTAGAIAGAWIGGRLAAALNPYDVMLVAGAVLLVALSITNIVSRRGAGRRDESGPPEHDEPIGSTGGFHLVFTRKYLLLIAAMVLTYNAVNSNGEFILSKIVRSRAEAQASEAVAKASPPDLPDSARAKEVEQRAGRIIGEFYGNFFAWVNLLTALIQLLIVSRVFKYLGVRAALFFLPLIALGSYAAITLLPLLAVVKVGKVLENSTDYSLQNTTRQALFLPTTRAEKYKAKAAIDSFFQRFGDVASFIIVFTATTLLGMSATGVAVINLLMIGLWLALCVGIARLHRKTVAMQPATR